MIQRFVQRDKNRPIGKQEIFDIIRSPCLTEKATLCAENSQYVFRVSLSANKFAIKSVVEKLFSVTVVSINTVRLPGKAKRFRGRLGVRSAFKKAIVKIQDGQSIDFSAGQIS